MSLNEIRPSLEQFKAAINFDEVKELDLASKIILRSFLEDSSSSRKVQLTKLQAVLDYTYEKVNIGNWKEVQSFLRKTMTLATYLKLLAHIISLEGTEYNLEAELKELFKIIDYGLLFGCPLDNEPMLLQKCATILHETYHRVFPHISIAQTDLPPVNVAALSETTVGTKLDVIDCPSLEHFYKNYILKNVPVVLNNCINHWPALTKWKDQNYLLKLAGPRTVPVELGSKYTDEDWTQKLMTLEEFIKSYIFDSKGIGYLAQYQLFEQIPELKNDITEPEYCCFSETEDLIDINAWYGPKGTVSPLHHDPKKNLLAQAVGEKKIYLFSPADSECLYPHEAELLSNTAKVDPREPDLNLYPKYKDAKVYYYILKAGQMLYIPPKWWHFVESLSISFSVSFWWN